MKAQQTSMSSLDVVVLLKIANCGEQLWNQMSLADSLCISQSEISKSIARSKFAGLLDSTGRQVRKLALLEFIQYGISYVFPQQPGAIVRGLPTAHSAPPLVRIIVSEESYVWPSGRGKSRGQSIIPLYPSVIEASENDNNLYELLALVDAIRVGRAREKEIAIKELKLRLLDGK